MKIIYYLLSLSAHFGRNTDGKNNEFWEIVHRNEWFAWILLNIWGNSITILKKGEMTFLFLQKIQWIFVFWNYNKSDTDFINKKKY